jgi:hypothetical protein
MNWLVRDFRGVDNAALRSYDQRPARKSIVPQVAGQTLHISGHHWLERSIDAGGAGAAIFAQGRVELVRKRIGNAQHMLFNQFADAQFVLWIDDRPQETDRDGLDVFTLHGLDGRDHCRVVEGRRHRSVRQNSARRLEGERTGNVGLGIRHGEVEGVQTAAFP